MFIYRLLRVLRVVFLSFGIFLEIDRSIAMIVVVVAAIFCCYLTLTMGFFFLFHAAQENDSAIACI